MEEQPTGIVVYATKSQIEEFRDSVLWHDICRELDFWIEGFAVEQDSMVENAARDNSSTASILLHLGDINGRKKAVTYFKQILDVFLSILEDKKHDSEHKRADRQSDGE
jgi:hypothetical protein